MVNFKYFGLPLLVVLCQISKVNADPCTSFAVTETAVTPSPSGCDVVPGLYSSTNSGKYIRCKYGEDSCTEEIIEESSCNESTVGAVINTIDGPSLCLGSFTNEYTSLPIYVKGRTSENYFVQHTPKKVNGELSKNVFTWNRKAHFYAVKANENSITYDSSFEVKDHCADINGKAMTRKKDFCSNESSGLYYTCGNDGMKKGVCTAKYQNSYTSYDKVVDNTSASFKEKDETTCECEDCTAENDGYNLAFEGSNLVTFKFGSTCTIENDVIGYYWNENGDIYIFDGEKWDKDNIVTTCNKETAGIIFKDEKDSNKIKFCIGEGDDNSKEITTNTIYVNGITGSIFKDTGKFYAIKKKSANENALVIDENINEDREIEKDIYECKKGICELKCIISSPVTKSQQCTASKGCSGKMFVDSTGKIINDSSKKGLLVNVENDGETITCTVISNNNGYYKLENAVNEDINSIYYPLIYCSGNDCSLKSAENMFEGYYLSGKSDEQLIECKTKDFKVNKSFINEGKEEKKEETVNSFECNYKAAENNIELYLNADKNLSSPLTNALIKCLKQTDSSSVKCEYQSAISNTYYAINPVDGGNLFKCDSSICEEDVGSVDKYYLDGLNSSNVINCDRKGSCKSKKADINKYYIHDKSMKLLITCSSDTCKIINGNPRSVYLSSVKENIIICNNNECSEKQGTNGKYYINGNNDKPLIYCSTGCTSNDGSANTIYINGNGAVGNNDVILCTSNDSCKEVSSSNSKIFINPNEKKLIDIDNSSNSELSADKAYFVNPDTFEVLTDNSISGVLVECKKENESIKCDIITKNYKNYYINGIEKYGKLITNNNGLNYMTTINDGLYINNVVNDVIECKSGSCNKLDVLEGSSCSIANAGKIIGGKLCTGTAENASDTENKHSITLSSTEYKYILGEKLYSVNNNKVVLETGNIAGSYYYLTDNNNKLVTSKDISGKVFKCVVTIDSGKSIGNIKSCLEQGKPETGKTYYTNSDTSSYKNFIMIICDKTACKSANKDVNDVYYVIKTNKLGLCSQGHKEDESDCYEISSVNGYYLSTSTMKLIKCDTEGICGEEKLSKNDIGYYINQDINNPLIQCYLYFGSVVCSAVQVSNNETVNYINHDGKSLINCNKGICNEINVSVIEENKDNVRQWFRGEVDKGIIKCTKDGCSLDSKPKTGWYISGETGYLIKCDINKDNINCKETTVTKNGYYINASSDIDKVQLIKCTLGSNCELANKIKKNSYYVNGDTSSSQLLYCKNENSCTSVTVNAKQAWYITKYDENTNLIKCDKSKKCTEETDSAYGYYINGDSITSHESPLLIVKGKNQIVNSDDNLAIGWYLNAGKEGNSDAIIRCSSYNSCITEAVRTNACSNSAGKFTIANVKYEWCDPNNKAISLETKNIFVTFTSSDTIPGVSEKKGIAYLEVSENSITRNTKVDGYVYDEDILYFCPKSSSGLCEKVEDITNGYYVNHDINNKSVLKCKDGKCYDFEESESNLIKKDLTFCKNGNDDCEDMKNINVDYLYSLRDEKKSFPGNNELEYLKAYVGKYYMKLNSTIEIPPKIIENLGTESEEIHYKILKDGSFIRNNLKYDYDTNYGFYIFENGILKSVYTPDFDSGYNYEEGTKIPNYKYECNIGGGCTRYKNAEEPIKGFKLTPDHVIVMEFVYSSTTSVMEEEIKKGSYFDSDRKVFIECSKDGFCQDKEDTTNDGFSITSEGVIKFDAGDGNSVTASTKFSKFLFQDWVELNGFNGRKRDYENVENGKTYGEVIELTHVSYTYNDETRNIFVGVKDKEDYVMITTESDRKEAKHGYVCNSGKCNEIDGEGSEKYYLNTAASNQNINAYAVCGGNYVDNDKKIICKLFDAEDGKILPNAAATGVEDALIVCSNESCKTAPITGSIGLPECIKSGKSYIRKDNNVRLLDDQFCLFNGKPVSINGIIKIGDDEKNEIDTSGIYMFDAALRPVTIDKVNDSYIYGSLYYCNGVTINCRITYGYIINDDYGYSKCSSTGCEYITNNIGSSCSIEGPGSIIKNSSGKLVLCTDDNKTIEVSKNDSKNIALDITVEGRFPETMFGNKILAAIKGTVVYNLIEDGYILLDNELGFADTTDTSGNILYQCNRTSKNCISIKKPDYGYYLSLLNEKVIECDSGGCIISNVIVSDLMFGPVKSYHYFDGSSSKLPGYDNIEVIVECSEYKMTAYLADDYILLNTKENSLATEDVKTTMSDLFLCSSSVGRCSKVDVKSGWYVSGDQNNKAIKCLVEPNQNCIVKKELNKNCSGIGDFIYTDNSYRICLIKSGNGLTITSSVGTIKELTGTVIFPDSNAFISINSNAVIGIGKATSVSGTDNDVYTMIKNCNNGNEKSTVCKYKISGSTKEYDLSVDSYCIYNDSKVGDKLFRTEYIDSSDKTKGEKCVQVKNEVVVLRGDKEIKKTDTELTGTQMYYCNDNSCRLATGYKNVEGTYFKCDYNGCDEVKVGNSNGDINNGSVKYGNNADGPMAENKFYYITGNNNFPGSNGKQSILVQSGKDYHIIFKGDGYYLLDGALTGSMKNEDIKSSASANRRSIDVDGRNGLYLCNSDTMNCILQNNKINILNGYFANGLSSGATGIIKCSSNTCDIDSSVYTLTTTSISCNSTFVGEILRDNKNTKYGVCISKSSSDGFTNSVATVKHYLVNLDYGNSFGEVSVSEKEEETKENETANILIKITNKAIYQTFYEGYILYDSGSSKDIISVLNKKGVLYYCKNNQEYKGGHTNQCKEVTGMKNGFYFSKYYNDNKYIKCTEGNCVLVEAIITNECKNSGSLIYDDNKFKLCLTLTKQVVIDTLSLDYQAIMNVSYYQEFPGLKANNTQIIASIGPESITMNKLNSYLVVRSDDNSVVVKGENGNDKGELYKCESTGACNKIILPNDDWYLKTNSTGFAEELIYCKKQNCWVNWSPKESFYVSSSKDYPLIQCIQPGDEIDGEVTSEEKVICKERTMTEGWFKNANYKSELDYIGDINIDRDKPLIRCDNEIGCVESKGPESGNGYYMNAANNKLYGYEKLSNATIYPILQCDSNGCEAYKTAVTDSCTKGGELVYRSNSYKICRSADEEPVDFSKVNGEVYQIIDISSSADFPDSSVGLNIIKITKYQAVLVQSESENKTKYYYKNSQMYGCEGSKCNLKNEDSNNEITIYETLTKNMYTGSCSSNSCTWVPRNKEEMIFIGNDNKIFNGNEGSTIENVYKCKKNESKSLVCIEIDYNNGYYYNSNYEKDDSGRTQSMLYKYKDGTWSKAEAGEENDNVRECTLYSSNVCYISYENEPYNDSSVEYVIPARDICATTNGKYYFAIGEINTGYDSVNCIPLPSDNTLSYYKIGTDIYQVDKYGAYKINENNYIGTNSQFILNGASTSVNGIWESSNPLDSYMIKCTSGKCDNSKTNVCSYEVKSEKCKLKSGNLNAGEVCMSESHRMYLALDNLSSAGGKCIEVENNTKYYLPDEKVAYAERDNEGQYYLIQGKMYKITNDKVEILGQGVYVLDNFNYLIKKFNNDAYAVDITDKSKYRVYVCNDDGCSRKSKCSSTTEFEYIYDEITKRVLKCDPETQTITRVSKTGYYVNGPWSNLIKCYEDGNCSVIGNKTGMEGYYKDTGNDGKMIVCRRSSDKFKCSEQNIISCNYDEGEGVCSGSTDLLRNSYCYYSTVDKVIGKVEKLMYVENFIKAGKEGKCITSVNDDYFFKYNKSKFLGNKERSEIIKVSKDYIVSIYEDSVGYYIIDTKESKGIVKDTEFKKSRMYKCEKNVCTEERPPKETDNYIYINKASNEKMVMVDGKYDTGKWIVMKNGCKIDKNNTEICKFINSDTAISKGDILFNEYNDNIRLYAVINPNSDNDKLKTATRLVNQSQLKEKTFIKTGNGMYLLNKDGQSLKTVDTNLLILSKNEGYSHNLVPYKSTVKVTLDKDMENRKIKKLENVIYDYGNYYGELSREGYYLNSADIDGLGIAFETMLIPPKEKPEKEEENQSRRKREENEEPIVYIRAVLNKCKSVKNNVCTNTQEGQIQKGSVCVVTDGDFKGLYFATNTITKTSGTTNCIKYYEEDDVSGAVTLYFKEKQEIAGQTYEKFLVRIEKDSIRPFRHDYDSENGYDKGYYVYDDNKLEFSSETTKTANAYYCDVKYSELEESKDEAIGYACEILNSANKYYLIYGKVMLASPGNKWKVETSYGYYFFNENNLPATIVVDEDENEKVDEVKKKRALGKEMLELNNGRYINSASDNKVLIKYTKDSEGEEEMAIDKDLIQCKVQASGVCTAVGENVISDSQEACYDGKKLYVIDVVDDTVNEGEKIAYCYTGSPENKKYSLIGDKLYRLDGLSIQEMEAGYYVINDNMEEFSSTYPEIPKLVVHCEGSNCKDEKETLKLQQDVLINAANNVLLRYYSVDESIKFMNAKRRGVYCLGDDGMLPDSTTEDGGNTECSQYKTIGIYYSENNIYPNMAKYGSNLMIIGGNNSKDSKIKYDTELEAITFSNEYNLSGKRIFKFYGNSKKLYLLKRDMLEMVSNGLYLMKNGEPFVNGEWTQLSGNDEICYVINGQCNDTVLKEYRKHQYMLNNAADGFSIVTYDTSNDLWRTVTEDGFYFFFDYDNKKYSIDAEDRRIYNVYEIKNGVTKEVTNENGNSGIFIFNDLYIEKSSKTWEDGAKVYENVDVAGKRKCTAIEKEEVIDVEELCYEDNMGMCMVKSAITDTTVNESNCVFSDDNLKSYYLVNGKLYLVDKTSYQHVLNDGLYVIDHNNLEFNSRKEAEADVYLCEKGKCTNAKKDLKSQFYLNEAGQNSIVYYNANNSYWKNVDRDGYYAFNEKGYPVTVGDEIRLFRVSDGGKTVSRIGYIEEGIKYISVSSSDNETVIYKRRINKEETEDVAEIVHPCKVDGSNVIARVQLKVGDICKSEQGYVLIKEVKAKGKREEEEEFSYGGAVAEKDSKKIEFLESEKKFIKMTDGEMTEYIPNGKIIIDKNKRLPLSSVTETEAEAYSCDGKECELLTGDKLVAGKRYINSIDGAQYKLVKYVSGEKWKVENEAGYYFFDEKMNAVTENGTPSEAFEVYMDNGQLRQDNISENNIVGYFFNKAASSTTLISNNDEFWSKGLKLRKCNVTMVEEGPLCKSTNETITYPAGEYCYNSKNSQIYLLKSAATFTEESSNCVFGSNSEPKYIDSSETKNTLNGVSVKGRLFELTSDAIRIAKAGYYIINQNGTLIDNNSDPEVEMKIYSCSDTGCDIKDSLNENERIITSDGSIFEMNVEGQLEKVTEDGLYFFDKVGDVNSVTNDKVASIVQVSNGGKSSKLMSIYSFDKGAYVNAGNKEVVAIYDGLQWSIEAVGCEYNKELSSCSNDNIVLNVGSYCVNEGTIYIINSIQGDGEIKKCIPGNDEKPILFKNDENKIMSVKSTSVRIIENDGYYALSASDYAALVSDDYVESNFIHCQDGNCKEEVPEVGRYLNKAPTVANVVEYPTGDIKKAKTFNNQCTVNENVCSIENGTLGVGDVCISSDSLYLVESEEKCTKVESSIESYKMVNGKMYKLTGDSVTQKSDGYFFINSESRAISNKEEYKKIGTVGYICNVSGDCSLLEPSELTYYPDYTTKSSKKYNVVKFDPSKKGLRKRQDEGETDDSSSEGSSGYEAVDEPGIYKMDDGSYVQCDGESGDEITCHDIDEKGAYETEDGEIIKCEENDKGEIECSQATDGGYYWIDDKLYECEPNDEEDQLECKEVAKEGYFLTEPDGELYECEEIVEETEAAEEETDDISKIYGGLNAEAGADGGKNSDDEDTSDSTTETTSTTTEETTTTTTTTEETTTTTTTIEPTHTPVDVFCKPVKCDTENPISVEVGDGVKRELYVCVEDKWIPNEECDSGSYIKEGDTYECEDEKDDVNETKIEQPNTDHTTKSSTTGTATTEATTTESLTSASTPASTESPSPTSSESKSTTPAQTTDGSTTTSATTTTTEGGASSTTTKSTTTITATATTTTAGARSVLRTLPSLTFYLFLLVITYYIYI